MPDRRVDRCGVGWSDASLTVDGLELTYLSSTDNNLHARTGVNKEGWGFEAGRWIHFPLVLDVVAISLKKTFFAQFSSVLLSFSTQTVCLHETGVFKDCDYFHSGKVL